MATERLTPPDPLLEALRSGARHFGPELATTAYQRGLAVTDKASGETRPIPITATPVVLPKAELDRRQQLAARLSSATLKMSRAVCLGSASELVLGALSPLERKLCEATVAQTDTLVTTRVDFFVGQQVRALEVNATIPAMQGYSDIAANTLIEIAGRYWGLAPHATAALMAKNGSNALALYRALLSGYAKVRPGKTPNRIALLSRRNDAQLTEQRYLCERLREWGADADLVHPDQLSGDDAVIANGKSYDLVYRHLFVRRLEEADLKGAQYVRALLAEPNGTRAVVLNPPASQVEVKAAFALLSQASEEADLARDAGLNDEELAAIAESVPWTRPFRGEALLKQVTADPDRYVIKRSWDYGGRAVFVGRTREEASYGERVRAAYGSPLPWDQLCRRAVEDRVGGGFVVQQLVETRPEPHLLCSGSTQQEADLYVDFSSYASVGLETQPAWGGVCRGSMSHIVNIVGGGGVIPLLNAEVAASLLNAYRAEGNRRR
ncbi:MAG: hypothetical protein H6Q89_501 [Myxococcaceae bacterium]|nr:hypothetical protein [Myxococcaceae bacterium]